MKPTRRAKTPSLPAAAEHAPSHRDDRAPSPPVPPTEVTRDYLKFIGIPSRTIDLWLRDGVLLATTRYQVYRRTPELNHRIATRLARGPDARTSTPHPRLHARQPHAGRSEGLVTVTLEP